MQDIEPYELEKSVWMEKDFSEMGWHDSLLYGFASVVDEKENWKNELYFDIDYIFQWVEPKPPNSYYTFWVSPCTLIFKNFYDLKIEIDMDYIFLTQIMNLERNIIQNEHNRLNYFSWAFELDNGNISFNSEGFSQIVRKKPIYSERQWLDINQRGGISFDKTPC